jgi:gentisate 1,2-dioxygenase
LLPKGYETSYYRSTASMVFVVVEGAGSVTIAGQEFDFLPHDIFIVPSWHEHLLEATSETVLFSYSDQVVQEKLDFFRERRT